MASSFHWVNFEKGTKEFARVIRSGGRFVALWNPRLVEENPLLVEIEEHLIETHPDLKRMSSGRSGITATLTEKLVSSPYFDDVIYMEGRHIARQTPDHYMGIWWSVNDIRVQIGENNFSRFMDYVKKRISGLKFIETTYLTRAWAAKRV
jgi:SAM-dependent methyltransferase